VALETLMVLGEMEKLTHSGAAVSVAARAGKM
jgi:hypothetical protein